VRSWRRWSSTSSPGPRKHARNPARDGVPVVTYPPPMLTGRPRLVGPGFAVLALSGAWLAHGLEYLRVAPDVGLGDALGGPLHRAYMGPLGLGLGILLMAGGGAWLRLWWGLGRRLDAARSRVRSAWRNRPTPGARPPLAEPSCGARLTALTSGLAVAQLAVYALQENVEAAAAGRAAPGLAVVTGTHWAAPLIHVAVALALSAAAVLLTSLLRRRVHAVLVCERLAASLAGSRPLAVTIPAGRPARRTPRDRFGATIWERPPPAQLLPS
jgi:hypothetical protein